MSIWGSAVNSVAAPRQPGFIGFVRGGDRGPTTAWIAKADGSDAREIAIGDEPYLSPNGAYVTVQRYTASGVSLELFSTSGKLLAGYFDAARDSASTLAWSPDSRYLAVTATSTRGVGRMSLYLIDTSTLRSRLVANGVFAGASFNPMSTRLVFGMSGSPAISGPVNLYTAAVTGGPATQITYNGNSFDPVWARTGIVFDRSTSRGTSQAPVFQLWLQAGRTLRQLTKLRIPALLDGLSPLAADADGNRLLAEYTGTDTSQAWTVQLSPLRIQEVKVGGTAVQGGDISSDGQRLLIDAGGFEQSPNHGEVETIGFAGGTPVRLARGTQPSWSG